MAKKRTEAKIVFLLFLFIELAIIGMVIFKGKYTQLEVEMWKLWTVAGGFLVIYVFYLKFRTQSVEQHVVDEKVKTHILIDALPGGVVILDDDNTIVAISQKGATIFALDPLTAVGKRFDEVSIGDVAEKVRQGAFGRLGPVSSRTIDILPLPQGKGKIIVAGEEIKASAGKGSFWSSPTMGKTDLSQMLNDIVARNAPFIKGKNAKVSVSTKGDNFVVNGDESLLRRAFSEIVANALLYVNDGGTISIVVSGGKEGVDLSVKDDGVGIPEDEIGKIFDMGFTGSNHGNERGKGSGLGLAIAKGIVEAHRGSIWAESRINTGTAITANIPR